MIAAPFVFKMFYGIITEAFPICGSTKKNYIIVVGIIHSLVTIPCYLFKFETIWPLVILTAAQIFCAGVLDVVIDGMIVI